jgi:hypothetical protein
MFSVEGRDGMAIRGPQCASSPYFNSSDKVVEQDTHSLCSSCAATVRTYGAGLRDIVGTRRNSGG